MDCGITGDPINDLLSFIGLGSSSSKPDEPSTPSTVGLDEDEVARDAAIRASSKKLSFGVCLPGERCSPAKGDASPRKEMIFRCTDQNCRMKSGICVDCSNCHDHCLCGDKHARLVDCNGRGLPQHQQLRKSPSMLSDSSDGSACLNAALAKIRRLSPNKQSPNKSSPSGKSLGRSSGHGKKSGRRYDMGESGGKANANSRRYDMEDNVQYLHLTHELLAEHTYRSGGETSSNHSYSHASYNSSNNSSSRRRYNFGDEDDGEEQYHSGHRRRTARSRRRSTSRSSGRRSESSAKSSSFSLKLRGRKTKGKNSSNHGEDVDLFIGKTFSFESDASRTRGSATTAKRVNSNASSLSSSSSRYLYDGSVPDELPKKSWLRRKFESKE